MSNFALGVGLFLGVTAFLIYPDPAPAVRSGDLACTMKFDLSTWVLSDRQSEGRGIVHCASGASMHVRVLAKGARLHETTSLVDDATGTFTGIRNVADLLGAYTDADVARPATQDAQILSKGNVMLALSGGNGHVDVGAGLDEFVLTRSR